MKRLLAILLVLTLSLSLFSGCTAGGESEESRGGKDEQVTLTIGIPQNSLVDDYDTNSFTEWLEEKTGYNLEFVLFQSGQGDYKSQLSTYTLTGEPLPDILWNFNLGDAVYREYGESGYFLDISEMLNDKTKSEVFWNSFEKLDETFQKNILRRITEEDGSIYVLPRIEETEIDIIDYMVFINKTWLKNLNLDMPSDTESLYQVLKAFKTQDPNGNGMADEIPIIGLSGAGGRDVTDWIINMFTYHNSVLTLNTDKNGKLYAPQTTDEYREALIYMNKLCKEGLLSTSCWTMSYPDMRALINPVAGTDQKIGVWVGHPTLVLEQNHDGVSDWTAMPIWGNAIINENANTRTCFITSDCEHVEEAWDLLMTMYSEEGAKRMRYGEEGVDWVAADPGTKSFLGYDAEIKLINDAFAKKGNECWKVVDSTILLNSENETSQLSDDMPEWLKTKMNLLKEVHDIAWNRNKEDGHQVYERPLIVLSVEDEESISDIRTNVTSFMNNALASFVCGTGSYDDPNSDIQWKNYLNELDKMGLNNWIKIMQDTLDHQ